MIKTGFTFLLLFLVTNNILNAQGPTDLFVVDLNGTIKNLKIKEGSTYQLTDRKNYDNQPNFINDKQLAFSAADDKGNNDIIIYNFENSKFTNLTKTTDSKEYSPSITDCGLYVSAVTVEPDGKQRLWLYPTNFGEPELLYDDIEPVGYYDWHDNKAAMYVLGQPNKLIYPYSKNEILTIGQNVGRSIRKRPKSTIITYIDMSSPGPEGGFLIKGFDLEKKQYIDFGQSLKDSEDFIWLDKNHLLMAGGNAIYLKKHSSSYWIQIGSINVPGYGKISRMAYSPELNKLVVVLDRLN
jgi:hypothetical protein